MKFTTKTLSETVDGKLPENQPALTRKEMIREKLQEDPDMIKRGYEHGWIIIGERVLFVRSRWEANLCAYFEYLKSIGELTDWAYEPEIFWFEGIKRGTNNYKPDFRLTYPTGRIDFIEVKGYWESKDTVKMNRMKKYHPKVNLLVIATGKMISKILEQYPGLILNVYARYEHLAETGIHFDGWGQPFKKREEIQALLDEQTFRDPPKPKKKSVKKVNKLVL